MARDDLPSLPIPRSAKSFLRRSGTDAMKPGRQLAAYAKMVADVTHQPIKGFKNRNAGRTTAGAVIEAYLAEVRPTMAAAHRQARAQGGQQQQSAPQAAPSADYSAVDRWEREFLRKFTQDRIATMDEVPGYFKLATPSEYYPYGRRGDRTERAEIDTRTVWGETVAQWLSNGSLNTEDELEQMLMSFNNYQQGNEQRGQQQRRGQPNSAMQLEDWFNIGQPYALTKRIAGKATAITRLPDAINAATQFLKNESKRIAAGLKKDRQNAYIAYIRSNDTKAVQAKFTQRLAGKDTHETWQPQTDQNGNQVGNHSKSGYTLEAYGWNTGEKPGTVWDKVNKFGTDTKEKLDKFGGKAAGFLRKMYGV
jgi:hypothetical protein